MQVLVFNAGSASLKFDLVQGNAGQTSASQGKQLVSCIIEGIGSEKATLSVLDGKDVASKEEIAAEDYGQAAAHAIEWLKSNEDSESLEFDLVGHRVVHGGDEFDGPAVIEDRVVDAIAALDNLAPLHNMAAVKAIESARRVLGPDKRMVAVFDTTFHRTLPPEAFTYALPHELNQKYGIRRYGFHGLSHSYLLSRYCELTARKREEVSLLTMHLESGSSICAIRNGESVETSMGFTPLEGLVMGKRSGDIDPALVGFLARSENLPVDKVEDLLNHKSGLLGLSGISHDTRDLMEHLDDPHVQIALDVFCHRIRKYIGAYLAVLNGAEAVVFGGGIGEDSPWVRERICRNMEWLGLEFDKTANEPLINEEGCISKPGSRLHAWVITTEEALMLAWEAMRA